MRDGSCSQEGDAKLSFSSIKCSDVPFQCYSTYKKYHQFEPVITGLCQSYCLTSFGVTNDWTDSIPGMTMTDSSMWPVIIWFGRQSVFLQSLWLDLQALCTVVSAPEVRERSSGVQSRRQKKGTKMLQPGLPNVWCNLIGRGGLRSQCHIGREQQELQFLLLHVPKPSQSVMSVPHASSQSKC